MKIGDNIDPPVGTAAYVPKPNLLNTGFRMLTDNLPGIGTLTRFDIKTNKRQYSIAFNSSDVGKSILKMPKDINSMAVNISIQEFVEQLEFLILELKSNQELNNA